MTQTKFNISQAAIVVGKNRTTVSRHIKSKKISFEVNEQGHKIIDRSELERVYGSACNFLRLEEGPAKNETERNLALDQSDRAIQQMQERLIQKYEQEKADLKDLLKKALDNQSGMTKLIEYRSQDKDEWQRLLDETRQQIAQEMAGELDKLRQEHHEKLRRAKRALARERQKSLWQLAKERNPFRQQQKISAQSSTKLAGN